MQTPLSASPCKAARALPGRLRQPRGSKPQRPFFRAFLCLRLPQASAIMSSCNGGRSHAGMPNRPTDTPRSWRVTHGSNRSMHGRQEIRPEDLRLDHLLLYNSTRLITILWVLGPTPQLPKNWTTQRKSPDGVGPTRSMPLSAGSGHRPALDNLSIAPATASAGCRRGLPDGVAGVLAEPEQGTNRPFGHRAANLATWRAPLPGRRPFPESAYVVQVGEPGMEDRPA